MLKWLKKNRGRALPLLCYGLYALVWLGVALTFWVSDRARAEASLSLTNAEISGVSATGEDALVTEGADAQLIFTGLNAKVRLVRLQGVFGADPGELELFYTRKEGQGFSPRQRVLGVPQNDGSVLYMLPAGTVRDLRVDLGTTTGNPISGAALTLNPTLPKSHYFLPNLRDVTGFLLWPALALCTIYSIIEGVGVAAVWRKRYAGKRAARGNEAT